MQNDPEDQWWKGRNVFCPAIKGISLVIGVLTCRLLSVHYALILWSGPNPSQAELVLRACHLSSRPRCLHVNSYAPRLRPSMPVSPDAKQLQWRWCHLRVCRGPTGPSFGFWPIFRGNLGQFWCCCECLRPFIIANHVIHPQCLCFQPPPPPPHRTHTDVLPTVRYSSTSTLTGVCFFFQSQQ